MNSPASPTTRSREAFFIGSGDDALYAMAHRPARSRGEAVVICAAFADDIQRSYRLNYNLAEKLAEAGYLALRFDYRGCGDSALGHEETDLATRLDDIGRAVALVKEKYGTERVTLLGLRLGGNLASEAANNCPGVERLILWEPIISGRKYLYDCLRANIASQMFIYRQVKQNREQQVAGLSLGEPVNIDGYEVNQSLFEAGCLIDLQEELAAIDMPTLLINIHAGKRPLPKTTAEAIASITAKNKNVTNLICNELPFWLNKKIFLPTSDKLYCQTINWLGDQS